MWGRLRTRTGIFIRSRGRRGRGRLILGRTVRSGRAWSDVNGDSQDRAEEGGNMQYVYEIAKYHIYLGLNLDMSYCIFPLLCSMSNFPTLITLHATSCSFGPWRSYVTSSFTCLAFAQLVPNRVKQVRGFLGKVRLGTTRQ